MAITDYERKAEQFLRKHNAKMTISHVSDRYGEWTKGKITDGYLYRVRIDRNGKSWSFDFSDSVANRYANKRPTKYDVLACIEKGEPYWDDVWEFANEFGYEIHDKASYNEANRIYKAVIKECNNVNRIFGDCLEELAEIA